MRSFGGVPRELSSTETPCPKFLDALRVARHVETDADSALKPEIREAFGFLRELAGRIGRKVPAHAPIIVPDGGVRSASFDNT